jgi:hypothetical protein
MHKERLTSINKWRAREDCNDAGCKTQPPYCRGGKTGLGSQFRSMKRRQLPPLPPHPTLRHLLIRIFINTSNRTLGYHNGRDTQYGNKYTDVNSALRSPVAVVSEVHAASMIKVEVSMVAKYSCTYRFCSNKTMKEGWGGRCPRCKDPKSLIYINSEP